MNDWKIKPNANIAVNLFYEGRNLKSHIFDYSLNMLAGLREKGYKTGLKTQRNVGFFEKINC